MAELADALDSGSSRGSPVEVQVLLPAPPKSLENTEFSRLFAFYFPLSHGGRGDARPAQGQISKMFLITDFFKIIFWHRKSHPTFTVRWRCIMFNWISRKLLFTMICFENNQILELNSTLHQKPVHRIL